MTGRIGWRRAQLTHDYRLRWRGGEFDLEREVVRHRDQDGHVEFRIGDDVARYRRRGPSVRELAMDAIDFTADEPWTWEDGDFGLFVFHLATRTGPMKYRHRFDDPPAGAVTGHRGMRLDDAGFVRELPGMRRESVRWDGLVEVRAKFELSGIHAEPTLFVLDDGAGIAVAPVGFLLADARFAREQLLPRLRALPGWRDEPFEAAVAYAEREYLGPREGETRDDWAERGIWRR